MSKYHIKGLAKGLIEELIKADMSMHERQIEAWTWMNKNRPKGAHIPHDIMKGLSRKRYLALNEVTFDFHVKPVPVQSFWDRLRLAFKLLFNKNYYSTLQPYVFDICSANDEASHPITLYVKRLENGKIKASYQPDDEITKNIMFNSYVHS